MKPEGCRSYFCFQSSPLVYFHSFLAVELSTTDAFFALTQTGIRSDRVYPQLHFSPCSPRFFHRNQLAASCWGVGIDCSFLQRWDSPDSRGTIHVSMCTFIYKTCYIYKYTRHNHHGESKSRPKQRAHTNTSDPSQNPVCPAGEREPAPDFAAIIVVADVVGMVSLQYVPCHPLEQSQMA